ncbi:unnamed protein product [Callosobruchus maculatus]|uniref:Uncharacterized protein n=1 Tax=Callosobruchus maculatus TaxID=64391 RepID=A0A653C7W7_CALMS|nr:unnamed protein product [Callosobruchus maculatus]
MDKGKAKATRLRFSYEDELVLLKEFLNNDPVVNPKAWEVIQSHVLLVTGKKFLIKTLKQHLQMLLSTFTEKEKVEQVRSGIEEPVCERTSLLQEVSSFCKEYHYDFK